MSSYPQVGSDTFNTQLEAQGYSPSAVSAAESMVSSMLQLAGYPMGMNIDGLVAITLQYKFYENGLQGFWDLAHTGGIADQLEQSAPWAMYGLPADTYKAQVAQLQSTFKDLTGGEMDSAAIKQALYNGQTSAQMAQQLQGGADPNGAMPYLAEGVSYQKAHDQYVSIYGAAPASKDALASWYKFQRGTRTIGGGKEAALTNAPPPQSTPQPGKSETR